MTQPDPSAPSGAPGEPAPSGGTVGDGSGNANPDTSGQGAATTTTEPVPETVNKADFDRLVNQLRAADQKRDAAEKLLRQLQEKDLPEAERQKRESEALKTQSQQLQEDLRRARLENAFLSDNTHKWHDPKDAIALADMSGVTVNEDGSVTGLKEALAALAKAKPHLVDKGTPGAAAPAQPAAGAPPMNGRSAPADASTKALQSRLPALGSRRRPQ